MIETANHFRCIDMIIETAKAALTEKYIKELRAVFAPLRKKCKCKKIVMDIKNSLVVKWHYQNSCNARKQGVVLWMYLQSRELPMVGIAIQDLNHQKGEVTGEFVK